LRPAAWWLSGEVNGRLPRRISSRACCCRLRLRFFFFFFGFLSRVTRGDGRYCGQWRGVTGTVRRRAAERGGHGRLRARPERRGARPRGGSGGRRAAPRRPLPQWPRVQAGRLAVSGAGAAEARLARRVPGHHRPGTYTQHSPFPPLCTRLISSCPAVTVLAVLNKLNLILSAGSSRLLARLPERGLRLTPPIIRVILIDYR
jgi:hypothetical protein